MAKQTQKRGGENVADAQRKSGGPRVHGHAWQGGGVSEGTRGTELDDKGTRGAVFGHGGKGKVQRARKARRPR